MTNDTPKSISTGSEVHCKNIDQASIMKSYMTKVKPKIRMLFWLSLATENRK